MMACQDNNNKKRTSWTNVIGLLFPSETNSRRKQKMRMDRQGSFFWEKKKTEMSKTMKKKRVL